MTIILFKRYKIISKLSEGSFGKVYKGIDIITQNPVAIKVEIQKTSTLSSSSETDIKLKKEASIYKILENTPVNVTTIWPRALAYGVTADNKNIMVMDLLGMNIETLMKNSKKKKLSPSCVAYIAYKMINLVQCFHKHLFIHRDLKPQNFVLEYNVTKKYPEIHLIDYGLAKSYMNNKKHIPYIDKKSLIGTVRFSSINTHLGIDQSRRDDVQSLGYIFAYLLTGSLPWQNMLKDKDKKEGYHIIMLTKMKTEIEELLKSVNHDGIKYALMSYILYTDSLSFSEEPNYKYMMNLFIEIKKEFDGNIFEC